MRIKFLPMSYCGLTAAHGELRGNQHGEYKEAALCAGALCRRARRLARRGQRWPVASSLLPASNLKPFLKARAYSQQTSCLKLCAHSGEIRARAPLRGLRFLRGLSSSAAWPVL